MKKEQNLKNSIEQTLNKPVVKHSILHESFLVSTELSKMDRYCVVSFIRPFTDVDMHTATNICQYTLLNGYYYAEKGIEGLDNEFKQMFKSEYSHITGIKPIEKRNKFQDFLERKTIASDLFKRGMALYCV